MKSDVPVVLYFGTAYKALKLKSSLLKRFLKNKEVLL